MRILLVCLLILLSTVVIAESEYGIQTDLEFENGEFEFTRLTLARGGSHYHEPNDMTPKIVFRLFDNQCKILDEYDRWFPEEKVWDGPLTDWDDTGRIQDHYREWGLTFAAFNYDLSVSHIAQHGMAQIVQVDTQLMSPACLGKKFKAREFGGANPFQVPDDEHRMQVQSGLARSKPQGENEPIIVIKAVDGYRLWEGWHRTMSMLRLGDNGRDPGDWTRVKINAWVGSSRKKSMTESRSYRGSRVLYHIGRRPPARVAGTSGVRRGHPPGRLERCRNLSAGRSAEI